MYDVRTEIYEMIKTCYDVLENQIFIKSLEVLNIVRNSLNDYIRKYQQLGGTEDLSKFLKYYV